MSSPINSRPKTERESTSCSVTNPHQVCAPKRGAGAPLGMRPRRCAQERDCADALASRSRVGSPQAGPLLRRTRAHLAVVRVLPGANFARFLIDVQVPAIAAEWRFLHARNVAHELMGQDTSDREGRVEAAVRILLSRVCWCGHARISGPRTCRSCRRVG